MSPNDLAWAWELGFTAGYEECASGGQVDATYDNPYREPTEDTPEQPDYRAEWVR